MRSGAVEIARALLRILARLLKTLVQLVEILPRVAKIVPRRFNSPAHHSKLPRWRAAKSASAQNRRPA
jgi:hypothetical protein